MKPRVPENDDEDQEDEEFEVEGRGRSAARREAKTFDAMAYELVALPNHRCKKLPVSERMKAAVDQARNTFSKAARRRHLRHLAGLLRESELETAAIQAYLAGEAYVPVVGDEDYRDLAKMREDLCNPDTYDATVDLVCERLPGIDLVLVSRLVQEWHAKQDEKSYRAVYKELNRALDELTADETTEE